MSSFTNIPNYSWQSPVQTAALLPPGGQPGDARVTLDTDHIWVLNNSFVWVDTTVGTASNSFTTIQTDTGTFPTATSPTSTLDFTTYNTSIFSFGGNSITDVITFNALSQAANLVYASPNGSYGIPTFRALVPADVPFITSGTVTSISIVTANGLAGTVANPTTTPTITLSTTITGILKGNGTAISAAISGTDYQPAGNYITALTGDAIASGPGSSALTFATVNLNVGTFNSVTVNGKGLVTAASNVTPALAPIAAYSTLANNTNASAIPIANQTLILGTPGFAGTGVLSQITGSNTSLLQSIWQNTSNGTGASTDLVLNNDLGTNSTYYANLGINSSNFTGSGSLNLANASYLTATTGDLAIGTTTNNAIHFVINGGTSDAMTISTSGLTTTTSLAISAITAQVASSSYSDLVIDAATGIIKTAPVTTGLLPVLDNTISTPPVSPNVGDSYIVASSPTGAWAGQTNAIATWSGSAWAFYTPVNGNQTTVTTGTNAGLTYNFNGTSWIQTNVTVSAWQLNGNTVGSLKTFGTLDAFDVPFVRGAVEKMRLGSNGLGIATTSSTTSLTFGSASTGITAFNTSDQTTNFASVTSAWSGGIYNTVSASGGTFSNPLPIQFSIQSTTGSSGYHQFTIYDVTNRPFTGAGIFDFTNLNSSVAGATNAMRGGYIGSSTFQQTLGIYPTVNQSGSASFAALYISPYLQASVGSPYLIQAGTNTAANNSGTNTNKFSIDTSGNSITAGQATISTIPALGTAATLFLVSNSGVVSSRTASQVLSDLGGGVGSVTSVGLSLPSFITVSGSPITSSGTLTGTLATQSAATVFAGPISGSAAAPTFRALVSSDLPQAANLNARVATTANLTATYSNGTAGVGATLTNSGTLAALVIDTVTLSAGDTVMVWNQTTQTQNGLYTVTIPGSGSVAWVLTRSTTFDGSAGGPLYLGATITISQGSSANAGLFIILNTAGPYTVGTTALNFVQNSAVNTLLTGLGSNQTVIGATTSGGSLTLSSTANSTKGSILFGTSSYNESTNTLGIGAAASTTNKFSVSDTVLAGSGSLAGNLVNLSQTWNTTGTPTAIKLNITNTASNAASLLQDLQVGATSKFNVRVDGRMQSTSGWNSNNGWIDFSATGSANGSTIQGATSLNFNLASTVSQTSGFGYNFVQNTSGTTSTSGTLGFAGFTTNFIPTSGTGIYNVLNVVPTINQTGGANGITRGFYLNPTLTAAVDFRAIETTNGKVLFTDTFSSGSGSLAGSLLTLNQTWNTTGSPTTLLINAVNTASGASAKVLDVQVGGTSVLNVPKAGGVNVVGNSSFTADSNVGSYVLKVNTGNQIGQSGIKFAGANTGAGQMVFANYSIDGTVGSAAKFQNLNPSIGAGYYSTSSNGPGVGVSNGFLTLESTNTSASSTNSLQFSEKYNATGDHQFITSVQQDGVGDATSNGYGSAIGYYANSYAAGNSIFQYAKQSAVLDSNTSTPTSSFRWYTSNAGSIAEAMRLSGSNLIIGSTSSNANTRLTVKDGHLGSTQTTAPVATVNANAGTGATCSLTDATDVAGNIALTTTATSPASGAQCSIAFNKAYAVAPICTVTNTNSNSVLFSVTNGVYFTTTTTTLVINYANADAIGHANTMSYNCIETQ